jgi:endonuclease/exonuclease/phosphatase family metal-dependent hydrolase
MAAPELLVYSWNTQASFFDTEASWILRDIDARVTNEVQLIAVALQEAVKPGSQFVSLILPNHLAALGFVQLRRSRLMGVGVTTYKALQRFDLRLRGLRLALYARRSWLGTDEPPTVDESYCYCAGIYQYSLGKGALSFALDLPKGLGRLRLINTHLPFDAASLGDGDSAVRQASVEWQSAALRDIWAQLVQPEHDTFVILAGDLNYRVRLAPGETAPQLSYAEPRLVYEERDELRAELAKPGQLPALSEGVNNAGPTFAPTAKLLRRSGGLFNHGKVGRRAPSWCDRVLYAPRVGFDCESYERCEPNPATADSDHASVVARFRLAQTEK